MGLDELAGSDPVVEADSGLLVHLEEVVRELLADPESKVGRAASVERHGGLSPSSSGM
jgi:hypothetical protein